MEAMKQDIAILIKQSSEMIAKLAAMEAYNKAQQKNIDKFWSNDWPMLIDKIDDVSSEVDEIKKRVTDLEINTTPVPKKVGEMEHEIDALKDKCNKLTIGLVIVGFLALGEAGVRIFPFI